MWKLKVAEDTRPLTRSVNKYLGRQTWVFDPNLGTPEELADLQKARENFTKNRFNQKHSADLILRMQFFKENPVEMNHLPHIKLEDHEEITEEAVSISLQRVMIRYSALQAHDGHWPADLCGPGFSLPLMVMGLYLTGTLKSIITPERHEEMLRYVYNHQNEDGGWGFHLESPSTMQGTCMHYVALRLLGEAATDGGNGAVQKARNWILNHGGATYMPSWGKFWLSTIGVYEWSGNNTLLPEMWLLPYFVPFHPGRTWATFRVNYAAMSYLYGKRLVGPITPLILSMREELYDAPYNEINWDAARYQCAQEDQYNPRSPMARYVWDFMYHVVEPLMQSWPCSKLRDKALDALISLVHYEDDNSRYICLGIVNKVLNLICCWLEDPNSEAFKFHLARVDCYFWVAEDGFKVKALEGSQIWDVALSIQAIISSDLYEDFAPALRKAHDFLKDSQTLEDCPGDPRSKYRHHRYKGSWAYGTADQAWYASDCTAEALMAILLLSQLPPSLAGDALEVSRIYDAVEAILSLQHTDGGFPSFELPRIHQFFQMFNPDESLGEFITDCSAVECTGSAIESLALFNKLFPGYQTREIQKAIKRAVNCLEEMQRQDGSWCGNWGICFTYASFFGVKGLAAVGKTYNNSSSIRKACCFLISKQLESGGWGESYLSCHNRVYTNLEGNRSHVSQTAMAMLALMAAGQFEVDPTPVHRAARALINMQMEDGEFPQQEVAGCFSRTCVLMCPHYRSIYPIWALGRYRRLLSLSSKKTK